VIKRTGLFAPFLLVLFAATSVGKADSDPYKDLSHEQRMEALRRAQVWRPTDIPSLDIKTGPQDVQAFAPEADVTCEYFLKDSDGDTPKFWCAVAPGDEVKIKYGKLNGEVYGEVAATRLLWALGFGADRMYPVKVICRGCSADPFQDRKKFPGEEHVFETAALERPMPGHVMESSSNSGWNWLELDNVDQTKGGAPVAHRHALKLLAVFMQHTDSKSSQQRLVCLDEQPSADGRCGTPFMMLNDVGRTFGKANVFNHDMPGSVDLKSWSSMSIWKGKKGCVANMPKSMSGSLQDPAISDAGRKFLANLLAQLSDQQIRDLFDVARVTLRQPNTTLDAWVAAFKQKRDEIATRSCAS
jgi:hypothetical protein